MNYYVLCAAALLLCLAAGAAIVFPLLRRKRGVWRKLLLAALTGLLLAGAGGSAFLASDYRAQPAAAESLISDEAVTVSRIDRGFFFDGPGEEAALVFYPGARVEESAYAPLMRTLAANGLDCFLVKMPLRMAVLGMDAAEEIRAAYDYGTWLLAGHSLGGAVAANLAAEADFDALVLLAAYPTHPLPEGLRLLSICGSEDGCLNRERYAEGRGFWPADAAELLIPGGNHAQFGCYGPQRGDGEATISPEQQQRLTAEAILALVNGN